MPHQEVRNDDQLNLARCGRRTDRRDNHRGGGGSTCAAVTGGAVMCWGNNDNGELGDGTASDWNTSPVFVAGVTGASVVEIGDQHACVLVSGTPKCWGLSEDGQLGNGTEGHQSLPLTVLAFPT